MSTIGFDAKRYFLNHTGLGNYSRDLIRILETYYPENTYYKYTPKIPHELSSEQLLTNNIRLPRDFFSKLSPRFWRNSGIIKDLKKDQVNIFHGLSGEIPIGLQEANIKSVVTIHDLIFLHFPELYSSVDRWIYDKKARFAVKNADKIIAISEQTKKDIIHSYDVPENKIEVIYQVSHPAFKKPKSDAEKQAIKEKLKLPENFLLNVGSIEPRKNAFQIVKAVETLDIPLLIIGKETAYSDSIKEYVAKNGLESKVIFMKGLSMEELAVIYSLASIFIYPSKYEGFGIPIIEALYSGTPVITTNSGVFPEAGGPKSRYVNPNNIEELQNAIIDILSDQELARKMSSSGLEFVQRFNDDVIAKQLNKVYSSLI